MENAREGEFSGILVPITNRNEVLEQLGKILLGVPNSNPDLIKLKNGNFKTAKYRDFLDICVVP